MESWKEELYSNELYHYGIKGQQWGKRRYQNKDGSLTEEGRRRYLRRGSSDYGSTEDEETHAYRNITKALIGKANANGQSWTVGRRSFRSYDASDNGSPTGKTKFSDAGRMAAQDHRMVSLSRAHNNKVGNNAYLQVFPGSMAELARRDGVKAARKTLKGSENVNVYNNVNEPDRLGTGGPNATRQEIVNKHREDGWTDETTNVRQMGKKHDAMESNRRTALERIVNQLSKVGSQALDKVTETAKEAYDYVESVASQAATMASDAYAAAVEAGQNLLDQILGK